jgi:hypothetical protein
MPLYRCPRPLDRPRALAFLLREETPLREIAISVLPSDLRMALSTEKESRHPSPFSVGHYPEAIEQQPRKFRGFRSSEALKPHSKALHPRTGREESDQTTRAYALRSLLTIQDRTSARENGVMRNYKP